MQTKTIKQIVFGLFSVGASIFLWKSISQITVHGGYAHLLPWIGFAAALAAAEGFLFLLALGRNYWLVWLVSVLNAGLILLFFGHGLPEIITAICFALAGGAAASFPAAIESSTSGAYHHSAYRLSWPLALVLLGFGSFLSAALVTPAKVAGVVSNYGFPYISSNIAPFNTNQTVDSYLTAQIEAGGIVSQATPELLAEGRKGLGQQIGVPVQGGETMSDVGRAYIAEKVQQALTAAGFANGGWFYLFIILLIVLPLLRLVIAVGSDIFVLLGKATHLVHTGERQVTVKTLDL